MRQVAIDGGAWNLASEASLELPAVPLVCGPRRSGPGQTADEPVDGSKVGRNLLAPPPRDGGLPRAWPEAWRQRGADCGVGHGRHCQGQVKAKAKAKALPEDTA